MKTIIKSENWTYQKMLEELPAESRYEIRNYNLLEMASPKLKHQIIVAFIWEQLKNFCSNKELGKVIISPFDVIFDRGNVCQPDVLFVSNLNKTILTEDGVFGSPDLVVEVVSKGSVSRDYIEKKNDYEKFGVKEYWIIDPRNETVWIYALNNENKYELFSFLEDIGTAKSKVLEGFEITFTTIFTAS